MKKFKYIAILLLIILTFNSVIYAIPEPKKIYNTAPKIDLLVKPKKKPVDIVIMTDYTGTKLTALNSQINALKANFYSVNVDPVFHIVSDIKNIGTQNDELYMYRRYASYNYLVSKYSRYTPSMGWSYYYNTWYKESILWEEMQGLASQYANMPKRTPTSVSFTRSSLITYDSSRYTRQYYNVTIQCSNDVKSSGMVEVEKKYDNWYNGYFNEFDTIISQNATIDTKWTREEKITDTTCTIYSLNFDKLSLLPLRAGSDRHMIFLSDASAKDYSRTFGNYFSFGELTDTVNNYIKNNNFTLYGVVPDATKDMSLLPEKTNDILTLGDTTLFYMKNGQVWKLGDPVYAADPNLISGTKLYPEIISDIGMVKEVFYTSYGTYMYMSNGTMKYFDKNSNQFKTVPGLSNIKGVYSYTPNSSFMYLLDIYGKIYTLDTYDNKVISFNNTVVIEKILFADYRPLFKTSGGTIYVTYEKKVNGVWVYNYLTSLRISYYDTNWNELTKSLPLTKNVASFNARAPKNSLTPIIFLYNDGRIQQFSNFTYMYTENSSGETIQVVPYIEEDAAYSILQGNVASMESAGVCVFLYMKDGTTRMVNTDWVQSYYRDKYDDRVYYQKPVKINETRSVPLSNIQKTFPTKLHKHFFMDINNNIYMYDGKNNAPLPVIGTTLKNMGNNINKIVEDFTNKIIYILYNDKTVRQLTYTYSSSTYSYTQSANMILPYTDVKDVYVSTKNTYLLTNDGYVLGKGSSVNGQLGTMKTSSSSFINPFTSSLSFDTTKRYYSLIGIFKESAINKFYSTGQYATAFNDIYKEYENYSGTGDTYILLGDELEYESNYDDRENDPEYQRKLIISHNPNYFDNSMGLSIYHNPTGFTTNPPVKLDKVGKYIINLKARDNPKSNDSFDNYRLWSVGDQNLNVYIHRKPIPLMNVSVTKNANATYTIIASDGGSYDLDHINLANKGIVAWEWAWHDQLEDTWHYGAMNKVDATGDRTYIISLRVKDMEGVWSDWLHQTIDNRQPPIAKFDLTKTAITASELAQIKDTSYAIMSNLTNWHWIVKRINDDGTIGTTLQEVKPTSSNTGAGGFDTNLNITKTNPGAGRYRIYLRVKADNGFWSDGGTDAIPTVSKMFYRDLTINQALSIEEISLNGRWNHFRGWTDKFGIWKDVMKDTTYVDEKGVNRYPYRFLCYEKVDLEIRLAGYADKVIIDFPDGLGSMSYIDKLGYSYSYLEDIGYTVSFPYEIAVSPTLKDPTITWSYILPLVDSSASWENTRLKQPYTLTIKAIKGSYEITKTKKIDITGNIDDLIFIQPVER